MNAQEKLGKKIDRLEAECTRLREENRRLRDQVGLPPDEAAPCVTADTTAPLNQASPVNKKVELFRQLFRGREDVYPLRRENRKGRAGYSPACANEWDKVLCGKPRVKCARCRNRQFLPVTDEVIHDHLSGEHTVGIYPIREDETCRFLATDFDKSNGRFDAIAFLENCAALAVPACLERSRSGNGGHVWIFFESPLPVRQ